jgi:hypothetical protein
MRRWSRRQLFGAGLLGALALGFASLAARTLFRGKPAPAGLTALTPREAAVLDILSLVYFPPGIALGLDARQAGMVPYLDGYVSTLGAGERKLMRAMLLAFDQGTLLAGKWTPAPGLRHNIGHLLSWCRGGAGFLIE